MSCSGKILVSNFVALYSFSRCLSSYQLYDEWLSRGGLITLHSLQQPKDLDKSQGGSVRCGSLLHHVSGK